MEQLLIVEDDRSLNIGLTKALQAENRKVVSCFDLRSAREQFACGGISAVILDINLPDGSGLELLREIKQNTPSLPVILLTANDTDMDIVDGLEQGADDSEAVVKGECEKVFQMIRSRRLTGIVLQ